ncbi:hypothetical protein ACH4UV_33200 [Streptomyces sp. NPDC020802]|uniref:hypothetical protein n=1 Tax=Streptomyces sp. NPDC020802 TaxID=3365094 RepID=UPI003793C193
MIPAGNGDGHRPQQQPAQRLGPKAAGAVVLVISPAAHAQLAAVSCGRGPFSD